ncbi:Crp/Fnr family transcriptional regulator [Szabonella alba]|uniref:Crp/Fnr family transcriptional regulator n=1 Tax=Szabonella alba TaxID=2804194 RepID=A0A8K0V4L7_9RHOB|nr:Crp/Fnr family transcriptional regulator [Szabonella alba]MBL4915729.1 Crp/Fnr family transcriptional regulator [Szabonella alba]
MATDCLDCPLRNCGLFVPFSAEELEFMREFKAGEITVMPGETFLSEGDGSSGLYTVLEGAGTRYKTLEDGRRQVINFLLPGDFIGMQASLMGEMKHSASASTVMRLCRFNRADLWKLFRSYPERAYALTWIGAVEEHFLGEAIATLGQRDAGQRLGWALLRLHARQMAAGLARGMAVPLAFRQQDLADALGLSLVHTNKTLARFRRAGWADWSKGWLKIPDRATLAHHCGVENEGPEPRPLI